MYINGDEVIDVVFDVMMMLFVCYLCFDYCYML